MDGMTVYNLTKDVDRLTVQYGILESQNTALNNKLKQTTGLLVGASIVALALGIFNVIELYLFEDRYGANEN